ncbi:MAG: hypothetical protein Q9211_004588 [Gyalolechia sp. 1 TL-2023]
MTTSADFDRMDVSIANLDGLLPVLNRFFNDVEEPQSVLLYRSTLRTLRERHGELDSLVNQLRSLKPDLEAAFEREHADLRTSQQTLEYDRRELLKSQKTLKEDQNELSSQRGRFTMEQERLEEGKINLVKKQAALETETQLLSRDRKDLQAERDSVVRGRARLGEDQKALKRGQDELEQERSRLADEQRRLDDFAGSQRDDQQNLEVDTSIRNHERAEALDAREQGLDNRDQDLESKEREQSRIEGMHFDDHSRKINEWYTRDRALKDRENHLREVEAANVARLKAQEDSLQKSEDASLAARAAIEAAFDQYKRTVDDRINDRIAAFTRRESEVTAQMTAREVELQRREATVNAQLDARRLELDQREAEVTARQSAAQRDDGKLEQLTQSFVELKTGVEKIYRIIRHESGDTAWSHGSTNTRLAGLSTAVDQLGDKLGGKIAELVSKVDETLTWVDNRADQITQLVKENFDKVAVSTTALESTLGRVGTDVDQVRINLTVTSNALLEKLDELPSSIQALVAARESGVSDDLDPLLREIDIVKMAIIDLNHQLWEQPPTRAQPGTLQAPLAELSKRTSEVSLAESEGARKRRTSGRVASGQESPASSEANPPEQSSSQSRPSPLATKRPQRRTASAAQLPGPSDQSLWYGWGDPGHAEQRAAIARGDIGLEPDRYLTAFFGLKDARYNPPSALGYCAKAKVPVCWRSYTQRKGQGFSREEDGEVVCSNCGAVYLCIRVTYVVKVPEPYDPLSPAKRWFLERRPLPTE